ncbi:sensor histidine kinase [uncultured Clostridium sp.]|uniref:sensor histidine kinase n=1 Tax=uncultured Clostridium sp. TaxID=59620 RepID=UPI0026000AB6|nr:histidine kinase [uncultured Clostridium sp.]MDU4884156.1 histidine kinase [Clostridium celatum]MDU7077365.1 histidine kinase [Clostridium celatum]
MLLSKNLSIKKLTLLIFLLIYFIYFLITSISLYSYSKYELSRVKQLNKSSNEILSYQIKDKINNISDASKYPLLAPDLENLHTILSEKNIDNISNYIYLKKVCDMMLVQNSSINGAFIYDLDGNNVSSIRNNYNEKNKNPINETWLYEALSSHSGTVLFTNLLSSDIFDSPKNEEKLIGLTRQIVDFATNKVNGILLLTMSIDKLKNLLTTNLQYNNQVLSIYDNTGSLIATTDTNFSDKLSFIDLAIYNSTDSIKYNNTKYLLFNDNISELNWTIVNSTPNYNIHKSNYIYFFFFLSNLICLLILMLILFIFFIKRLFKPIQTLVENMSLNNIEKNLNQHLSYKHDDELGSLFKSYNQMKYRINNLITINYKTKLEQKDLELRQLQNQINPHFIYNTLESIHMMAEINGDLDTSKMAQCFGSIIRYSMNRKINTVTLEKELSIIDNYIYLQKIRFDQIFTIENLVPNSLLQCEIIKMIIQPLIENSIFHGFSECDGEGKITIKGEKFNNYLIITISDNGIGIDEKKLKELNDYINDRNSNFKGIALRNINRRLQLKYGSEFGLKILGIKDKGTSMILTLPFIIKENN